MEVVQDTLDLMLDLLVDLVVVEHLLRAQAHTLVLLM